MFADPGAVKDCVESLETFHGTALGSGFDVCAYVDFHGKDKVLKTLMMPIRGFVLLQELTTRFPDILCDENPLLGQPPENYAKKDRFALL